MKKLFLFAWIVSFVFSCCAYGQENSLVAGEQVLQSIELTQSNQKWNLSHREKDLVAQQPIAESQTETLNYWVFMPRNETAKTEQGYPLILFLHGMGERGAKPELVKKNGLPKLLTQKPFQNQCPFIVVSPQCPDGKCWSGKQLVELVEKLLVKYPVDKSRVYITGLSMGGFGTWAAMAERPDLFAAGIPVCGGGDIKNAEKLVNIPIWDFHGDCDPVVSFSFSVKMVDAIRDAGGTKVKFTPLNQVQHNAWDYAYCYSDIYRWLLEQKKSP